ncbi:hypothetical protein MMC13_004279 [Lambiella insularis]|nr:hypothetical protein [Lambiella insularis]
MAKPFNTIHIDNGYEKDSRAYYPVLIVGAGAGGIALGCRLKEKLGFDQFRIFDRQAGIGGVLQNLLLVTLVPALFYSFSWAPLYKSSTFFPPGPEIIKYFHDVCDRYQITDKIQLNTDVAEMLWLEEQQVWEVTLQHMATGAGDLSARQRNQRIEQHGEAAVYVRREIVRAKIVASCVGGLVEPNDWPKNIPGRENFQGDIFHSARWNYDVSLTNKDVVVLGTGCSAAQFTALITKAPYNAKSCTQLMRSPPWVVPKAPPPFGPKIWAKWSGFLFENIPGLGRFFRTLLFLLTELDFATIFHNTPRQAKARAAMEKRLVNHMKKTVPKKYHEILTPDYGVGCKRRIFDEYWLRSMNDPKYNLTTQPLTEVKPKSVILGPGRTYPDSTKSDSPTPTDEVELPADVIILANGFDISTWLHPLKVRGREGKLLQDVWDERGGAQAYLGTAVDGFPNFFVIFGPNTATGHSSVILAIENMVEYTMNFMKLILDGQAETVEIKKSAEDAWTKAMQEELKHTVWMSGGCHSWYFTENGWNSTAYP